MPAFRLHHVLFQHFQFCYFGFMLFYYVFILCLLLCMHFVNIWLRSVVQFSHYSVAQKRELFNVFANLMKYFGKQNANNNHMDWVHDVMTICSWLRLLNIPDFVHLLANIISEWTKKLQLHSRIHTIQPSIMANGMAESKYWCLVFCFCFLCFP